MNPEMMDAAAVRSYVEGSPAARRFGPVVSIAEIGDGYLNQVFRVSCEAGSLIIKHSFPYVRVDPSWKLSPERLAHEAHAYRSWRADVPDLVPEVYWFDHASYVLGMEDLVGHVVWREALAADELHSNTATRIGHFARSIMSAARRQKGEELGQEPLGENAAMKALMAEVIFENPFMDHPHNSYPRSVEGSVMGLRTDSLFRAALADLHEAWWSVRNGLIHGDLHTGSIMVAPGSTKLIDAEFCFDGPVAWDLGAFVGSILLATIRFALARSDAYESACQMPEMLEAAFTHGIAGGAAENAIDGSPKSDTLANAVGYAGLEMIRRIIGSGKSYELLRLSQSEYDKAAAVSLEVGQLLVMQRHTVRVGETSAVLRAALKRFRR